MEYNREEDLYDLPDGMIYDVKSSMLFQYKEYSDSYEPVAYDAGIDSEGEIFGTPIEEGDIFHHFIMYVRFSSMIVKNKGTGETSIGKLELYQWHIAFQVIRGVISSDSSELMCAISRQAGKTHVTRKVIAFLIIFAPLHMELKTDRFYAIFVGAKKDLIEDHCLKMQPELDKSIELFNMMHPDSKIITKEDDKSIKSTLTNKNFDRMLESGEVISYSSFDALTAAAQVNAGYSAHLIFVDEAQEIPDLEFNMQIKPFRTATAGCVFALGTL